MLLPASNYCFDGVCDLLLLETRKFRALDIVWDYCKLFVLGCFCSTSLVRTITDIIRVEYFCRALNIDVGIR